jgi:hypothetical protein
MVQHREIKDKYVGAQVSRRQKSALINWCKLRDTTPSQWIRRQIESIENDGGAAYA